MARTRTGGRGINAAQQLRVQNEQLQAELLQARAENVGQHRKNSGLSDEEKRWKKNVGEAVKKYLWGQVKFCNDHAKLARLTVALYSKWDLKEKADLADATDAEKEAHKMNWIGQNKDYVRQAMNECRNYAQSQLRGCIVERIHADLPVPTPEEILNCAIRDDDFLADESNHWVMDFYVDVLIFRVVGKQHWDTDVRHYNTVSSLNGDGKPRIYISTEALLVAIYENCWTKWQYLADLKKQGKKATTDRKDEAHNCPFIDTDTGRCEWGGWNIRGRKRVKAVAPLIKEGRDDPGNAALEQAALNRIRAQHDIVVRDARRAAGRGKKRKEPEAPVSDDENDEIEV